MSKKDRLKAQSLKQLEDKRKLEELEKQEKENVKESRSAAKMRRQARRFDTVITMIIKILMLVPYGYSGLVYAGIFAIGIEMGENGGMEGIPKRYAIFFIVEMVICFAAIFFTFYSKYVVQFVLNMIGTGFFMTSAQYIIKAAQQKLAENYVEDAELKVLDKTYMLYFYPFLALTFLSAVLFVIYLVKLIRKKRREKRERDNAPVKSILD